MSAAGKASILANVASSTLPKLQVLRALGVPKSTYYRWLRRPRLDDRPGGGPTPWNRLSPPEEQAVLAIARRSPELSCRQLAAWITDNKGFSVSESTVYRMLRREGLGGTLKKCVNSQAVYPLSETTRAQGPREEIHRLWEREALGAGRSQGRSGTSWRTGFEVRSRS